MRRPDDCERELKRLREASERVAANLVELEIDSSRRMLDASALAGASAERWAAASATLTQLWQWRAALDDVVERAEKIRRSPRRADELESLLTGPSIELTRSAVPLAERNLLGSSEVAVRCTPAQLLEQMSASFDQVKTVVARFAEVWETLSPRLDAARQNLNATQALAASLVESERGDVAQIADRVSRLTAALTTDPLSVAPADVAAVAGELDAIRHDLEATRALRDELEARLAQARGLAANLQDALEQGQAAHEEVIVKIAVPSAPLPLKRKGNPGAELDQIEARARSGAWRQARLELDRWTDRTSARLDEAERIARANRAPIEARNQLRALLDAYQVKAARLGVVEDPRLEQIFDEAHEELYTAPTDLAFVAQLVRRYQEILNAAQAAPEVIPK